MLIQYLRATVPVLTPNALDEHLAHIQTKVDGHVLDLHMFYHTLRLQASGVECRREAVLVEDIIRLAVEECLYHCPSMPVRYEAGAANGMLVIGDQRMLQYALAGLLAAVPEAQRTNKIIRYSISDAQAMLTVADNPLMLKDDAFMPIDATTNLALLSDVTRHRLVALTHALQVALVHHGRLEILIWPEDKLAVRFVLPQQKN